MGNRYAPLALKIVYENTAVDAQRLARPLGWELIFTNVEDEPRPEQPVYMLFGTELTKSSGASSKLDSAAQINSTAESRQYLRTGHSAAKTSTSSSSSTSPPLVAVLAIRGTVTVQDVVTDIRAAPCMFPPPTELLTAALHGLAEETGSELLRRQESEEVDSEQLYDEDLYENEMVSESSGNVIDSDDDTVAEPYDVRTSQPSAPEPMHINSKQFTGAGPQEWQWLVVSKKKRDSSNEPALPTAKSQSGAPPNEQQHSYACTGMVKSAMFILRAVGPSLLKLHKVSVLSDDACRP
jgi:hypothetical protein